jgi:hypothetical protein
MLLHPDYCTHPDGDYCIRTIAPILMETIAPMLAEDAIAPEPSLIRRERSVVGDRRDGCSRLPRRIPTPHSC